MVHLTPCSVSVEQLKNEEVSRVSAHSDYGSVTFLFQDSVGGLEVEDPNKPGRFRVSVFAACRIKY